MLILSESVCFIGRNGPINIDCEVGGRSWIRTSVGVSQQIYSLPPLAAWVSYQPFVFNGLRTSCVSTECRKLPSFYGHCNLYGPMKARRICIRLRTNASGTIRFLGGAGISRTSDFQSLPKSVPCVSRW